MLPAFVLMKRPAWPKNVMSIWERSTSMTLARRAVEAANTGAAPIRLADPVRRTLGEKCDRRGAPVHGARRRMVPWRCAAHGPGAATHGPGAACALRRPCHAAPWPRAHRFRASFVAFLPRLRLVSSQPLGLASGACRGDGLQSRHC